MDFSDCYLLHQIESLPVAVISQCCCTPVRRDLDIVSSRIGIGLLVVLPSTLQCQRHPSWHPVVGGFDSDRNITISICDWTGLLSDRELSWRGNGCRVTLLGHITPPRLRRANSRSKLPSRFSWRSTLRADRDPQRNGVAPRDSWIKQITPDAGVWRPRAVRANAVASCTTGPSLTTRGE